MGRPTIRCPDCGNWKTDSIDAGPCEDCGGDGVVSADAPVDDTNDEADTTALDDTGQE